MGCHCKRLPLVKILLIIFTTIFWAFGVAILGIGIWIKTDPEISNLGQAVKVGDQEPIIEVITWLFIGSGIFVYAVGIVGLIGTIRGSKIMLGFYIVCIFIVFAAEASAGIYAGIRKDYIVKKIKDDGAEWVKTSYDRDSVISKGFNYVQVTHKCCGVKDFMDYRGSEYLKSLKNQIKANATLSYACCKTDTDPNEALKADGQLTVEAIPRDTCMEQAVEATFTYLYPESTDEQIRKDATAELCADYEEFHCKTGCFDALQEWTEEHLIIFVGVGIAIGACQLILLFLALWFCQSINKDEK